MTQHSSPSSDSAADNDPIVAADQAFARGAHERAIDILLAHRDVRACRLRLREWASAARQQDLLQIACHPGLPADDPESEVDRAVLRFSVGAADEALSILDAVCSHHPDLATAHHHAGRALQNLGQSALALKRLSVSLQLRPDYPEALYSQAHVLRATGQMEAAVAAYRNALKRMPTFAPALLNLGITLAALDRPDAALVEFDKLLLLSPHDVDATINKGLCLHALGRWQQALDCYASVLAKHPGHALAHFYLGSLYNEQKQTESARKHLLAALHSNPSDIDFRVELIGLLEQNNELEQAQTHLDQALQLAPGHPGLNLEAVRLARRAGDLQRAHQHLRALNIEQLSPRSTQTYWFERGVLLDRMNQTEPAMEAFVRGNQLAARSIRRHGIDRDAFGQRIARITHWLQSGADGAARQADDPELPLPFRTAFLVGFPRSGTTLLDTMLDAHTDVASIEERPTLEGAIESVLAPLGDFPDAMPKLNARTLEQLRTSYQQHSARWIPEGFRGLVLDKLPLRLLRTPLLHRLFPDAPILFAVRHPCDVVLSNFMQQYDPNEAFVHFDTLLDSARMYDQVLTTWRLMLDTLPIKPHWIRYESLVEKPEPTLADACEALGLTLQDKMLDTAARIDGRSQVRTNSYQQVAEPIYTRAIDRWRRYERWLEPVLPVLQPHIRWLGY